MTDPSLTLHEQPADEAAHDPLYEQGELPRRPRRRFLQPLPVTLLAVLAGALGLLGGIQIEKGQGSSSGASAAGGFARGRFAGGVPAGGGLAGGGLVGGGPVGANVTAGEVTYVKGGTLYVAGREGNTVKVTTSAGSRVTRTVAAQVKSIHPGDTVLVQGETGKNGAVSASSLSVTSNGGSAKAQTSTGQSGSGGAQALFGPGG
ncbi:MAG: hypothetical protein ACYDC2_06570 [Solirubrobacteraceae bacterium]